MMNRRAAAVAIRRAKAEKPALGQYQLWFTDSIVPVVGAGTPTANFNAAGGFLTSSLTSLSNLFTLSSPVVINPQVQSILIAARITGAVSNSTSIAFDNGNEAFIGFGAGTNVGAIHGYGANVLDAVPNSDNEYTAIVALDSKDNTSMGWVNGVSHGIANVNYSPATTNITLTVLQFMASAVGGKFRDLQFITFPGSLPSDKDAMALFYHNNPLQKLSQWAS